MIKQKKLKLGIVGATGMVGKAFISLLEKRNFLVQDLKLFASEGSAGKKILVHGLEYEVNPLSPNCFDGLDLVFFSSGDDISKEWGPLAVKAGAYAIDNSAAFRMNPEVPLIVPEVNGNILKQLKQPCLIANPNCSTIQLVVALSPLQKEFGLSEVKVASYQAVSGAGNAGFDELIEQVEKDKSNTSLTPKVFTKPIAYNAVPQIGSFNEAGFSSEEVKIMNETKKILNQSELSVSAFTVRVPVFNAHSEAVWVKLNKPVERGQLIEVLKSSEGLMVNESLLSGDFPTARDVSGEDPVYVGRIHKDPSDQLTWMMWIVADNLKKGAALNGIQIAERLYFLFDS